MHADFVQPTFLGLGGAYTHASVVILGCPMDDTSSYRPGSRFAPRAVRDGSLAVETYSPALHADLEEVPLSDLGDLDIPIGNKERALELIARTARRIFSDGKMPLSIGGEHLVSLPLIRECTGHHPGLKVLQLDAHADMRDDYQGERLSHATVMRRITEIIGQGNLCQVGIRSGTRDEFAFMKGIGSLYGWDPGEISRVRTALNGSPCYISLDLDILDPGIFPATGAPEPGGLTFTQLAETLYALKGLRVVGIDVNEYNPLLDHSGHCSITAAKLIRELILLFGS
ncbi:MAG: agmatinase [bacterium]